MILTRQPANEILLKFQKCIVKFKIQRYEKIIPKTTTFNCNFKVKKDGFKI